jgi:hypothetical protein
MTCLAIGIVLSASIRKEDQKEIFNEETNPLEILSGQL